MSVTRWCPVSRARSAQKFGGKNKKNHLFRNVPGSKWRLLSNVLARIGKTGETAANWDNLRPWIGLFQGAKCDNVPKCDLEFA